MNQPSVIPLHTKVSPARSDRKDLELLLTAWKQEKVKRAISLKDMAAFFVVNYETVRSTYKGTRSLTELWKLRYALYLDKYPQDIWPAWEFKAMTTGAMPPQVNMIALKAQALSFEARRLLLLELDQLSTGVLQAESALLAAKINAAPADTRKLLLAQLDHWQKLESRKPKVVATRG